MALRILVTILLVLLLTSPTGKAQDASAYSDLLGQIGTFEGQRDPKCAATANRLEDFMYGTPLAEDARSAKADLQKGVILNLWISCSKKAVGSEEISGDLMQSEIDSRLKFDSDGEVYSANLNGVQWKITDRDLKHYGSVAYAYRAILSVQQDLLFSSDHKLIPLSSQATEAVKSFLDKATLLVLKMADSESRKADNPTISPELFKESWNQVFPDSTGYNLDTNTSINQSEQRALVEAIVRKKQEAFQEYNQISMFLFQRNAQVYFSRHNWPKDEKENEALRAVYNESLIQFIKDLWSEAEKIASIDKRQIIRLADMNTALHLFLPFEANQLEDITFFPKLNRAEQVDIEAYDLDAFRDGGVHWTYIKMAMEDMRTESHLMPDPFALELLSEGVAHLGVLSLRLAGNYAKDAGKERMNSDDLIAGLKRIQKLLLKNENSQETKPTSLISSAKATKPNSDQLFTDFTSVSGIGFNHRSSDWLNRFIRAYSIDSTQNLIRTAIPPAFGGGGIASEDLNEDGFPDLLLLGGAGNKLYINQQDGTFKDETNTSALVWKRPDGTYGEPRQPIIADFDNDGQQDIFISYVNDQHRIYRNSGDAQFEDKTESAMLGGAGTVGGPCTAFDFDNDGLLDIYIGYFGDYIHGIGPTLARKNKNGLPNKLFKNMGKFHFEEVPNAEIADAGWSQSIGHADINGDNFQDLIVGNDFGTNTYYLNNGDGTFTDVTRSIGTDKPSFTMNVGITDLNQDHLPDFYISNIVVMEKDQKYVNPSANTNMKLDADVMANMRVVEANDLFLSTSDPDIGIIYNRSNNVSRGYSATGWSWDADFFDYDNDGDQDLYCLTGMNDFLVYSTDNPYHETEAGKSKNVVFADSHRESNVFFENDKGKLNVVGDKSGASAPFNSRSATYIHIEMDGDLDIVLNNYHDSAVVLRNNSENSNTWLKLGLKGSKKDNVNLDAIGAKIIVTAKDLDVWHEVHSTTGYLSVHPKEQHIGTANHTKVDVEIVWPDSSRQNFADVETGHRYLLHYGGEIRKR